MQSDSSLNLDFTQIRETDRHRRFTDHVRASSRALFALLLSIVGNRSDAEDVLQDTIVILWNKFDEFEEGTYFSRWARVVAVNVAKDFCRKRRIRKGYGLSDDALAKIAQAHVNSTELLELRRLQLHECLEKLPNDDRQLVWRCYGKNSQLTEIATAEAIPLNTLYSRLRRIRLKLSDCVTRSLRGRSLD